MSKKNDLNVIINVMGMNFGKNHAKPKPRKDGIMKRMANAILGRNENDTKVSAKIDTKLSSEVSEKTDSKIETKIDVIDVEVSTENNEKSEVICENTKIEQVEPNVSNEEETEGIVSDKKPEESAPSEHEKISQETRAGFFKFFDIFRHKSGGFSLIEVAIAIVVIGLVVGLSLKGKELIHTAKVNSVADQVNTVRVATHMFTEKYGAIPGDFTDAKNSIDGSLENGTGSGNISTLDDARRFWSHLTKSGLLSMEMSNGFPVSKLGGYYSVSSQIDGQYGLWIVLTRGTTDNQNFSGIVSQEEAHMVDKKYDNGDPSSGEIRTQKIDGESGKPKSIGSKYDLKSKIKNCIMMFKLW